MRTITSYQCEECGAIYNTLEEAQKCEGSHGLPIEIVPKTYEYDDLRCYGYPKFITVKMSNGKYIEYSYAGPVRFFEKQ